MKTFENSDLKKNNFLKKFCLIKKGHFLKLRTSSLLGKFCVLSFPLFLVIFGLKNPWQKALGGKTKIKISIKIRFNARKNKPKINFCFWPLLYWRKKLDFSGKRGKVWSSSSPYYWHWRERNERKRERRAVKRERERARVRERQEREKERERENERDRREREREDWQELGRFLSFLFIPPFPSFPNKSKFSLSHQPISPYKVILEISPNNSLAYFFKTESPWFLLNVKKLHFINILKSAHLRYIHILL